MIFVWSADRKFHSIQVAFYVLKGKHSFILMTTYRTKQSSGSIRGKGK